MSDIATELAGFMFRSLALNKEADVEHTQDTTLSTSAIDHFSDEARRQASSMGRVYELLYCLENSIREMVESSLKEAFGADSWWVAGVPTTIRRSAEKRQADDLRNRWHGPRGDSLLAYVDFPQYGEIIIEQWEHFEALLGDQDWVTYYFAELNRTRRALAHTGQLTEADEERMEVRVRDWLRTVG
ncbi:MULTISPECIES: Swt1 family HEPN domain-containing protein [unclassified Aeromicrobium]|uniref:Swt1 family HEPN domain-containing protein n=1 Tax=unclassified Aeromicrobium TaxID=2633570 RepID=UPI00396B2265